MSRAQVVTVPAVTSGPGAIGSLVMQRCTQR